MSLNWRKRWKNKGKQPPIRICMCQWRYDVTARDCTAIWSCKC